ncbi:MAG: cytochrome b N-terminal domain-containing protein, partial [Planctomycetota bacterium]
MNAVTTWVESRTGWTFSKKEETAPASWGRSLGPICLSLLAAVLASGVLIWSSYAPTAEDAWASTHYLETAPGGALLRGVFYWATHALLVFYPAYLLRQFVTGGYRDGRDLAWVAAVLILPVLVVFAVTGNPLTGSAKAFAQLEVETNILATQPVIGPALRTVLNGGGSVGTLTLTRFYVLHAVVTPALGLLLVSVHIWQIRRFPEGRGQAGSEKETLLDQGTRDLLAVTAAGIALFVMASRFGAPLEAPPDPGLELLPRPEWYFLFLFELRTYFPPALEFVATQVLPGAVIGLLVLWPWLDRYVPGVKFFAVRGVLTVAALAVWAVLTAIPVRRDIEDPHVAEVAKESELIAERAVFLASTLGVPPTGAVTLLEEDPLIAGERLFVEHCAGCHSHVAPDGHGIVAAESSAPNLHRVGSREWVRKWLTCGVIDSPELMGNTEAFGTEDDEMVDFTCNWLRDVDDPDDPEIVAEREQIIDEAIAALSAEAKLPYQAELDATAADAPAGSDEDMTVLEAGAEHLVGFDIGCTDCHAYGEEEGGGEGYPSLVGYMSRDYMIDMIANIEDE